MQEHLPIDLKDQQQADISEGFGFQAFTGLSWLAKSIPDCIEKKKGSQK